MLAGHAITTARVAQAVSAEGSVAHVAGTHEISPRLVHGGLMRGIPKIVIDIPRR